MTGRDKDEKRPRAEAVATECGAGHAVTIKMAGVQPQLALN